MIDADDLIDTLSVSAVLDKIKTTEQLRLVSIMMPPTVESFIKEMGAKYGFTFVHYGCEVYS